MTLEELIRQAAEDHMKKATKLSAEAALTQDIWLRAINREKADVYSAAADRSDGRGGRKPWQDLALTPTPVSARTAAR